MKYLFTVQPEMKEDVPAFPDTARKKIEQIKRKQEEPVPKVFDHSARLFIDTHFTKGVVYIVKKIGYNDEGFVDSAIEHVFDIGTEAERLAKANKYLKFSCQNIRFSTVVQQVNEQLNCNRFELLLIKKDASGIVVLEKITPQNIHIRD